MLVPTFEYIMWDQYFEGSLAVKAVGIEAKPSK